MDQVPYISAEKKKKNPLSLLGALLLFIALLWVVEIVDVVIRVVTGGGSLDNLGIVPREMVGLLGIPFAPLLHGGFGHLISNTVPLIILGWLMAMAGGKQFWKATVIIVLVAGLGTWLFGGRNTIHFGASSLVFGCLGFVLLIGYFRRSPRWILIGIVVGVVYAGMIFSLFSAQPGVSLTGHLFGFLGGILAAAACSSAFRKEPQVPDFLQ